MIARLLAPVAMPLLGVLLAALVGSGGWIMLQARWLENAETTIKQREAELSRALGRAETCTNRLRNIKEAQQDAETAADPSFVVPEHWLSPGGRADTPAD
ncbi:hypothetical protein [Roseovarius nitratireducens]|uniref:hypothetical protein n=1 Tax=Roseovarius nitratireducens TaxID=2044597 RepID=UPI000CE1C93A|nr:hypothetical protein [Roseovarius nitratireducens]